MSVNSRVRNLERNVGGANLVAPNPDGSLPDSFRPFVDGVDFASAPAELTITWKSEPLDEIALIAGPNAIPHEEALRQLDEEAERT